MGHVLYILHVIAYICIFVHVSVIAINGKSCRLNSYTTGIDVKLPLFTAGFFSSYACFSVFNSDMFVPLSNISSHLG